MRRTRVEQQERLLAHLAWSLALVLHIPPGRRDVRVADELGDVSDVERAGGVEAGDDRPPPGVGAEPGGIEPGA